MILDLDDTLFDHQESARRGLTRLIGDLGARPSPEINDAWEDNARDLMRRRREGSIDRDGYRRLRVRGLLDDIGARRGRSWPELGAVELDALYERYLRAYEREWVGFPDAVRTLRGLRRRGLTTAILTNGPEERQQRKARAIGVDGLVTGVWASDRVGARKPDSRAYLTVCDELDLAPGEVLHVGDNPDHDVRGATAAGLLGVHVDRTGPPDGGPSRIRGLDELLSAPWFDAGPRCSSDP